MSDPVVIEGRRTGPDWPVFVIAEIGVNHNGSLDLAKQMVVAARECGVDCVKFQTFKAERVATQGAVKARYQLGTTDPAESQLEMLRKLELKEGEYRELVAFCRDLGLVFLSTPYNAEDADFLDDLGVSAFKIASGQAVELPFLEHLARKGKPLLLSTGMCTLAEVDTAVRTIRQAGNEDIVVLQCTTNYPSRLEDCNLRAMVTMGRALNVLMGYSDHTRSLTAALLSVALGACVVERHFTLDKTLPGPDQSSSSDPEEMRRLVAGIREAEKALGTGLKVPSAREAENLPNMRRSLTAVVDIPAGTTLSWDNLTFKRPGTGLAGTLATAVIGRPARCDIPADTQIALDMVG